MRTEKVLDMNRIPIEYRRNTDEVFGYGTAGFRRKAEDLPFVMFRVGVLAELRARAVGAVVGIMVTASHNPEEDNGVKLIEPMGEMLVANWEQHATNIVNASDEAVNELILGIIAEEGISSEGVGEVYSAYDTRVSSPSLELAAKTGVEVMKGKCVSYGMLTTPQLHFIIRCRNTQSSKDLLPYGQPTELGYYKKYSDTFKALNQGVRTSKYKNTVTIDGANGVGALKLKLLKEYIGSDVLNIKIVNCGDGKLNYKCGADYVKIAQSAPSLCEGEEMCVGDRWASLDGDADRIVYYFKDKDGKFHLLDGDRIAVLIAKHLEKLLGSVELKDAVRMGVVQTAYANGSSTRFLTKRMNIPVFCVPTGVKNLHKQAEELDIGVYFEANGHGTVLFAEWFKKRIKEVADSGAGEPGKVAAAAKLSLFIDLVNETVGDALADMLVVESILREEDWGEEDWNSLYTDLPNRQLKVPVPDRSLIQTTDAERKVSSPSVLQDQIDALVKEVEGSSRAFVRPSGTEDVVRVYAEAATQEKADKLAKDVEKAVVTCCKSR